MLNLMFTYIWLIYIGLTESLFIQLLAIFIFYIASKIVYAPTKNWYYTEEENL
jgi:hypothetical protein